MSSETVLIYFIWARYLTVPIAGISQTFSSGKFSSLFQRSQCNRHFQEGNWYENPTSASHSIANSYGYVGQSLTSALFLAGKALIWGERPNSSYQDLVVVGSLLLPAAIAFGQSCFLSKVKEDENQTAGR